MFRVTCLGHHCFLTASDGAAILVDPILRSDMGFTALRLRLITQPGA